MEVYRMVTYPDFSGQPELSCSQATERFSHKDVSCSWTPPLIFSFI